MKNELAITKNGHLGWRFVIFWWKTRNMAVRVGIAVLWISAFAIAVSASANMTAQERMQPVAANVSPQERSMSGVVGDTAPDQVQSMRGPAEPEPATTAVQDKEYNRGYPVPVPVLIVAGILLIGSGGFMIRRRRIQT